jgi:hypothetical protein
VDQKYSQTKAAVPAKRAHRRWRPWPNNKATTPNSSELPSGERITKAIFERKNMATKATEIEGDFYLFSRLFCIKKHGGKHYVDYNFGQLDASGFFANRRFKANKYKNSGNKDTF